MRPVSGGVTAAVGFRASGLSAGIKPSRKPDLALLAAERPVTAVGLFTQNRIKAAPVRISQARLMRSRAMAVLINSGCANCLTGPAGRRDALAVSRALEAALGVPGRDVLLASTGLIGTRLPVVRVIRTIPRLVDQLGRSRHRAAARAMLTTDRKVKEAAVRATIHGRPVHLGGMAKGAGMIAPSMATMLAVLTTDAAVNAAWLRQQLREVTEETFNRISVDGDMSTNDTVFTLASGRAGVTIRPGTAAARTFTAMLRVVAGRLAAAMVQDGEGASRTMEIRVVGARSPREGQACARTVACSPLVKTMLAGGDSNVGRIAGAVGASGAQFDPARLEIHIGSRRVVSGGTARALNAGEARTLLMRPHANIRIHLHAGRAAGRMLTCDLTEEYVRINARYTT